MRTLENLRLPLGGLLALIGGNGTGKSSILEACEILRRAAGERFLDELHTIHGGRMLLRAGSATLGLGITAVNDGADALNPYCYDISLSFEGAVGVIQEETLIVGPKQGLKTPIEALKRRGSSAQIFARTGRKRVVLENLDESRLLLTDYRLYTPQPFILQMSETLRRIRVHLPFEVTAAWAARASERKSALRQPSLLAPALELERFGVNLASAYHTLRNNFGPAYWQETMDYVRLGLGPTLEDVLTLADPGGGSITIAVKHRGRDSMILASQLSDGMLSYLAIVALFRLSLRATAPTLLALDEPENHLHPHLLARTVGYFEAMAGKFPVVLATQSDRLLDSLSDPSASARLCELDSAQATRIWRADPVALASWLEEYRGLGAIRGEGHEAHVMTVPIDAEAGECLS